MVCYRILSSDFRGVRASLMGYEYMQSDTALNYTALDLPSNQAKPTSLQNMA